MVTRRNKKFAGKSVLITAGPTWVAIDKVRVISNSATGLTGTMLAKAFADLGARVTLLLGPAVSCCLDRRIRLINFRFFDELKEHLFRQAENNNFDIIIHSAAVSDFRPKKKFTAKIGSGIKNLKLDLVPTEKLINSLRRKSKSSIIVGFKFEPDAHDKALLIEAAKLKRVANLDLVVANSSINGGYKAYILGAGKIRGAFVSKQKMINNLIEAVAGL